MHLYSHTVIYFLHRGGAITQNPIDTQKGIDLLEKVYINRSIVNSELPALLEYVFLRHSNQPTTNAFNPFFVLDILTISTTFPQSLALGKPYIH